MRAGMPRTDRERAAKRLRGIVETAQRRCSALPKLFHVGASFGCRRSGFFEGVGGVFVPARRRVRIAEVVLRQRKARLQRERIAKALDGVVDPAERLQRVAEVQLQAGVGRTQVHRATHEFSRFRVLPLLVAQHAEQMQGVDVARFGGERGLIVAFRFGQAAVTMGRETAGKYSVHDGNRMQTPHFPTHSAPLVRIDSGRPKHLTYEQVFICCRIDTPWPLPSALPTSASSRSPTCFACSAIRRACASCSRASTRSARWARSRRRSGLSASLVSHHLRLLRAARIVRAERQGKQVFYLAADRHISAMLGELLEHVAEPQTDFRPDNES